MLQILLISLFTALFIILILFIIAIFIIKSIKGSSNKTNKKYCKQKKAETILIKFENINYDDINNPFEKSTSFFNLKKKLIDISNNKKIKKIILNVNDCPFTPTQVEELYPIFKKLNEEKEVIALAKFLDNSSYMVALLADKIYLENTINSTLLLRGYYRKLPYLKGFLDKIGIKFEILHIGDYKAAGENFYRTCMSDTLKENLSNLYEEKLKQFIDFVKLRRNVDITERLLNGNLFFSDNKDLIDGRKNINLVLNKEKNLFNINNYNYKEKNKSKNEIALISLEGEINDKELSYKQVEAKIDALDYLDNLKGVVIEINSPGGSAYDSSLIYSYIKENVNVPIFISMKDVCASGGYFIATTGKKMFANKSTITGSIGVVSMYPVISKITKKLGLNYDGLQKGKILEYGHLYSHLSFETKDRILNHMKDVYIEFKTCVIKARHMSDRRLERIAGGRVWSSIEAKRNGLIDDIKTTDEVIDELAKYLNLKDYKVCRIKNRFDFKDFAKNKLPILKYTTYFEKPLMLFNEEFIK